MTAALRPRTHLSRALRSDVRPHIDTALDDLLDDGAVTTVADGRGRAYRGQLSAPRRTLQTGRRTDDGAR